MQKLFVIAIVVAGVAVAVVARSGGDHPASPAAPARPEESKEHARPSGIIVRNARRAARPAGEGPVRPKETIVQLENGEWGIKNPDGTITVDTTVFEPDESTIEGAISMRSMLRDHAHEVRVLQLGITVTRNERDQCLLEFVQRGGTIQSQYDWSIALTFKGDGHEIRVERVQALLDRWPQEFDEQAKDCYLESFARVRFASTEKLDMTVEFPLCVYPSLNAKESNGQEQ